MTFARSCVSSDLPTPPKANRHYSHYTYRAERNCLQNMDAGADVLHGSPLSPLRCSTISRPWRQLALNLCDPRNCVITGARAWGRSRSLPRPIPQSKDSLPVVAAARRTSEENPQEICQGRGGLVRPNANRDGGDRDRDLPPTLARAHPGIWPTDHVDIRGGRLWPKT